VWIKSKKLAPKVAACSSQQSEANLECLAFLYSVAVKEIMNALVAGNEGQTICQFKAPLAEVACLTDASDAEGGLVDQLQTQAGFDPR
jgi:hypothetical protein